MGARYRKLIRNDFIIKTDFLRAIEKIANDSSLEQLQQIRQSLGGGVDLFALLKGLSSGEHGVSKSEMQHVRRDWFDAETSWWRELDPAKVMREGLMRAIELRTENARDGRPLPVAYFWSPNAQTFAFVPLLSDEQLTVILLTPPEPKTTPNRRAAPKAKATRKAATATRKTASRKKGRGR